MSMLRCSRPRLPLSAAAGPRPIIDIILTLMICSTSQVSEGGAITSWETADYLFSEDATCPDTVRIFESGDYAENRLTVFHSFYLAACEKCHSVKSVCIGHYVLPPVSVQEGK
ncbi:telomere repeats-binding bouquet formation protein 2-like [Coregonus clupeaformis]|uniref:telomere repeats-binding bouquet formation protein 2-like n=1 Tax=Coregonus clupeaformis TaxID=59861 RepID=UPI001E1C396A|nr:telomere repeats-binding bouquet formation protein 2-like [Coregonus clupeaformis]